MKPFTPGSQSLRHLERIISPLITPAIRRRGLAQASIITDWEKIVREMADCTIPVRLVFPKGKTVDGCLHLWVDSGAVLRIEYARDVIISCINGYFGYEAVKTLKFHQTSLNVLRGNPAKKKPEQKKVSNAPPSNLEGIDSEALKTALARLGKAMGCPVSEP